MARTHWQIELTAAGKRDLIKLIEQGRPLPEKYRFVLFDDKRDMALRWFRAAVRACLREGGERIARVRGLTDWRLHLENKSQSFRMRQDRKLELETAPHTYTRPGRYTVAVKVIDIFGNDMMTLVPASVG